MLCEITKIGFCRGLAVHVLPRPRVRSISDRRKPNRRGEAHQVRRYCHAHLVPLRAATHGRRRRWARHRREFRSVPARTSPRVLAFHSSVRFLARSSKIRYCGRELVSARRGSYRLLHRIDDETQTVWVHRVDHRARRIAALVTGSSYPTPHAMCSRGSP
jgi:mRNA interferase RelE/StbE